MAKAPRAFLELAGQGRPVILVFEAAHWMNPDTGQIIDLLVEDLGSAWMLWW